MNKAIKNIELTDEAETILLALGEFTMLGEYDEPYAFEAILGFVSMGTFQFDSFVKALVELGFINHSDENYLSLTEAGNEYLMGIHERNEKQLR